MVGKMVEPEKLVCFTFTGDRNLKILSRFSVKVGEVPETGDCYIAVPCSELLQAHRQFARGW